MTAVLMSTIHNSGIFETHLTPNLGFMFWLLWLQSNTKVTNNWSVIFYL